MAAANRDANHLPCGRYFRHGLCPFGDDWDVYVFHALTRAGVDLLDCCGCQLDRQGFYAYSTQEMIDHLHAHTAAGHRVPNDVIPELIADDPENFPKGNKRIRVLKITGDEAWVASVSRGDVTMRVPTWVLRSAALDHKDRVAELEFTADLRQDGDGEPYLIGLRLARN